MPRIYVIHKSLTAFLCGLFGLLPVIGAVPGVYALFCWAHVRTRYPNEWNPASAYLSWGARLASLGLLISALTVAVACLAYS